MKYLDLRRRLTDFVIFSLEDIRKIEPDFDVRRLSEWQQKGYIKKVRRGYYIFSDLELSEKELFIISNKIYRPSYVSLESALSYYGLIPEGVFSITAITTKKTKQFNSITSFNYRSVKPEIFFGYRLYKGLHQAYKLADPEKTVLDYLYLNNTATKYDNLRELRFNGDAFIEQLDFDKFDKYLDFINSPSLKQRARKFLKFIGV